TAEYAEYAEKDCLSSWVSAYSAYSAVQDRSHLGFNYTGTKLSSLGSALDTEATGAPVSRSDRNE
ncbi:MAG: hypothetical protein ABSH34_17760, partial [Verrucomicrobiota bacterium]